MVRSETGGYQQIMKNNHKNARVATVIDVAHLIANLQPIDAHQIRLLGLRKTITQDARRE